LLTKVYRGWPIDSSSANARGDKPTQRHPGAAGPASRQIDSHSEIKTLTAAQAHEAAPPIQGRQAARGMDFQQVISGCFQVISAGRQQAKKTITLILMDSPLWH
jgi:hypothetical protein